MTVKKTEIPNIFVEDGDLLPKITIVYKGYDLEFILKRLPGGRKYFWASKCMENENGVVNFNLEKYVSFMLSEMIVENNVTDGKLTPAQIRKLDDPILSQLEPYVPTIGVNGATKEEQENLKKV